MYVYILPYRLLQKNVADSHDSIYNTPKFDTSPSKILDDIIQNRKNKGGNELLF